MRDPTATDPEGTCGTCHATIVASNAGSLHTTLSGIRQSIMNRSGGGDLTGPLASAFQNHCSKCHGSCGQCHVSVPTSAGGGFLKGHQFRRTPPMNNACVACHGSRVGAEYKGENVGVSPDLHYNKGMQCTDCHSGTEMHADGQSGLTHRSQQTNTPRCEDCHPDDAAFNTVMMHGEHRDADGNLLLACQVCHATTYKTCYGCHVSKTAEGAPIYEVNGDTNFESVMTFKIGLNPAPDDNHPEKWVVLRHVPIDPNNFDYYGTDALTTFAAQPTWLPAAPHTIQKDTPQNATCNACHHVRELFLGPDDLKGYEVDANASVVVDTPPGP